MPRQFLSDAGLRDAFGHKTSGRVATGIAQLVKRSSVQVPLGRADYLQRAARHSLEVESTGLGRRPGRVELALKARTP